MELHMTAHQLDLSNLHGSTTEMKEEDDEFSIPLDISDIINICREYTKLGWQIQNQVENILENGVEESIKSGFVKKESLFQIKNFLIAISKNPYFGDAVSQAHDCIKLIREYETQNKIKMCSSWN